MLDSQRRAIPGPLAEGYGRRYGYLSAAVGVLIAYSAGAFIMSDPCWIRGTDYWYLFAIGALVMLLSSGALGVQVARLTLLKRWFSVPSAIVSGFVSLILATWAGVIPFMWMEERQSVLEWSTVGDYLLGSAALFGLFGAIPVIVVGAIYGYRLAAVIQRDRVLW